jgi:hypothetical protein
LVSAWAIYHQVLIQSNPLQEPPVAIIAVWSPSLDTFWLNSVIVFACPAGAEAGAASEAGAAASGVEAPGADAGFSGGADAGFSGGADAGFSSGFGAQGSGGFGDDAESFKWDDVAGGASGGGDEESASGLWGILVGIWAMIFGE